jgi:hypothetical protein
MSTNEQRVLEQIVRELHMMNRVLERMVQAPIFDKNRDDDYLERMNIYMDDTPQEKQSI